MNSDGFISPFANSEQAICVVRNEIYARYPSHWNLVSQTAFRSCEISLGMKMNKIAAINWGCIASK